VCSRRPFGIPIVYDQLVANPQANTVGAEDIEGVEFRILRNNFASPPDGKVGICHSGGRHRGPSVEAPIKVDLIVIPGEQQARMIGCAIVFAFHPLIGIGVLTGDKHLDRQGHDPIVSGIKPPY